MSFYSLHPDHLADLKKSGLILETIQSAGIYTVPPDRLDKLCRQWGKHGQGVVNAYALPYPGVEGFERYRLFREEGISGPKYLQPMGTPNHLYIPPETDVEGEALILVVEGEKKGPGCRTSRFSGRGALWNLGMVRRGTRLPESW